MISGAQVAAATRHAFARGALQPIATELSVVEDAGVRFLLRVSSSVARKEALGERRADPLGDYERDLFVGDVPPAHYVLLNKFNVMPGHLLLVTRAPEPQECLLTERDFAAFAPLIDSLGGLGFYNGGLEAGASQPRKHLQLVPLPLGPEKAIPAETSIKTAALPFRHAFAAVEKVADLHRVYRELLDRCGIAGVGKEERQSAPYNLLFTREWMLLVPRRRERFESISVNALGFAGSLFVRDHASRERVCAVGPMQVLRAVAIE